MYYPALLTAMLPIDIAAEELLLGKWIFATSCDGGTPKVTICLGIWMCKSLNLINLSSWLKALHPRFLQNETLRNSWLSSKSPSVAACLESTSTDLFFFPFCLDAILSLKCWLKIMITDLRSSKDIFSYWENFNHVSIWNRITSISLLPPPFSYSKQSSP